MSDQEIDGGRPADSDVKFECSYCDATFNQASYRRQHIKKVHRRKRKRRVR